jgi:two-component system cell cycle response regulator
LLTSQADKNQVVQGLQAGADDYLTKPFHEGELLARLAVGRRTVELHRQLQLKNQQLQELAMTDALTGLPNRRAIEEFAARELSGALRHGFQIWAVMADLDHFKGINDTYGHESGDAILRGFADVLKANTRTSNFCGRFGGEEFLIILSHADRQGVRTAIERIREEFESRAFMTSQGPISATASFGIAGLEGFVPRNLENLLARADGALYRAKQRGRNRVEEYA